MVLVFSLSHGPRRSQKALPASQSGQAEWDELLMNGPGVVPRGKEVWTSNGLDSGHRRICSTSSSGDMLILCLSQVPALVVPFPARGSLYPKRRTCVHFPLLTLVESTSHDVVSNW